MPAVFQYFPFDTGPGANSDETRWGEMMRWMRTTGIVNDTGMLDPAVTDLAVTQNLSLGVQVAVGIAWVQGFYFSQEDDYYAISVNPNTSGDPRIDLLVLRLSLIDDFIQYAVLEGTPAPSPVVPVPQQDEDIWEMPLAQIFVADGAVIITDMDITDERVLSVQAGAGSAVSLSSAGGMNTLVNDGVGPALAVKGLTPGLNVSFTDDGSSITIDATDSSVTLASAGGADSLVDNGTGPALTIKGLTAGTDLSISDNGTYLLLDVTGGATSVTLSNAGTTSLVNDGTGPNLATKGLVAGSNISFSTTAADVTLNVASTPSDQPICILRRNANQTVANGATDTITWTTAIYDPYTMWNGTTTITVPETGYYEIKVNVAWTGNVSANGTVSAYAVHGGTTLTQNLCLAVGNVIVSNNSSAIVSLTALDTITVTAQNSSGVSLDVNSMGTNFPYISVIKVRS